jgi:hypothetical protein
LQDLQEAGATAAAAAAVGEHDLLQLAWQRRVLQVVLLAAAGE